MNIKNLKTVTISTVLSTTNQFSSHINIPFIAQFMKVKKVSFALNSSLETGFAGALTRFFFTIKSSLVNYESLVSFTIQNYINDSVVNEPIVGLYTEHLDTLFKLNNQIINGTYNFAIYAGEGDTLFSNTDQYIVNVAIQLEFIEYN